MFMEQSRLKLFSGRANKSLADSIAENLGIQAGDIYLTDFADNELFVKIKDNVRGADVFVVQPTSNPGHKNLMELLIIIDALHRASAARVTAVIPYYGYGRQERKAEPRVPITAKLIANMLTVSGADRILTMDLHAAQIQGFFDIPVDHLYATPVFLNRAKKFGSMDDFIVASPDIGGVERSRFFAKFLGVGMAILDKRREKKNTAEVLNLIGDVDGCNVIMVDDMVDTAGTIVQAAAMLKKKGAKSVQVFSTHAVLSGPAAVRLRDSEIDTIFFTDTIPIEKEKAEIIGPKLEVLSVAKLFAEAIKRIHENTSVSSLFVNDSKVE